MQHAGDDGQQFPIVCPACQGLSGMPFMAGTSVEGGAIRVGMRCRHCLHEWSFKMPVTVAAKKDAATGLGSE